MSPSEIEFLPILPVLLLAYWIVPARAAWQNAVLLLASWVFYASWSPRMLAVLVLATIVDYVLANDVAAHRGTSRAKVGLALSLLYNLGQLAFFKYQGFFATEL